MLQIQQYIFGIEIKLFSAAARFFWNGWKKMEFCTETDCLYDKQTGREEDFPKFQNPSVQDCSITAQRSRRIHHRVSFSLVLGYRSSFLYLYLYLKQYSRNVT